MRWKRFFGAVIGALCLLPVAGWTAEGQGETPLPAVLTIADAFARFDEKGFDLLLAEATVASAHGDLQIAGAVANPSLSGSVGGTLTYDPSQCTVGGCSNVSWGLGLSDNGALFDLVLGKRASRVKVAELALEATKKTRDDARRTLHFALEQALVGAVQAELAYDATAQQGEHFKRIAELTRLRFNAGAISEADVAKSETESLAADADVDRAKLAVEQARVAVAFLLGVRGQVPAFEVDRTLLTPNEPPRLAAMTVEDLRRQALEHRADVLAARANVTRADASIAAAEKLRLPDISLGPSFSMTGLGQQALNPPNVGLGVGVTLPAWYQYQGEIAKARADLTTQQVTLAKLEAQASSDVQSAFSAYVSARKRLERMHGALLDRATRARDLVKIQYDKGAASLLELIDAERQLIATNLEYLQDLSDFWTAIFQLEQAVGIEVRS
jgi:cobalt-zinc-cadmium efflux system outer membrane protein